MKTSFSTLAAIKDDLLGLRMSDPVLKSLVFSPIVFT
jgi:hypothetical protein